MHPDQFTSDKHRYQAPDSAADTEGDDAEAPGQAVSTPETDGARIAEAGNAYVGRMMDDALKSSPRVQDGDEAVDDDPTTPGDD